MKVILFDLDGTILICPPSSNIEASGYMFKKVFNLKADEKMIDNTGKTEKGIILEVLNKMGYDTKNKNFFIPNNAYEIWAEGMKKILKIHPPKVHPGIINLLKALNDKPTVLLAILTGNSRLRAEVKLESVNLEKLFHDEKGILRGVFGDISDKRSDLLDDARTKFGKSETYIIIDDSLIGAEMAKENDIPAILLGTHKTSIEKLAEYSKYVFKDLGQDRWKEVVEIIDKI